MNVFISQPMVGLTNDELKKYRSKVLDMIQRRYPLSSCMKGDK